MENDDYEIIQIDDDVERDVKFLTLILKKISPKIDSAETYSILMSVALGLLSGEMYEEEDAEQIGDQILDTIGMSKDRVFN
jgi:hypothetical protein